MAQPLRIDADFLSYTAGTGMSRKELPVGILAAAAPPVAPNSCAAPAANPKNSAAATPAN
jgi:hypothetical protein